MGDLCAFLRCRCYAATGLHQQEKRHARRRLPGIPADQRSGVPVDIELPKPEPGGHDLLVEVKAVSVNPVDTKVRSGASPRPAAGRCWAGTPPASSRPRARRRACSSPATRCSTPARSTRQGTNAEFHLVDERIVGRKPKSLDFAEAAALPLTAITAWEALFDRLDIRTPVPGAANAILIIGGAGGVGSIAIQLPASSPD